MTLQQRYDAVLAHFAAAMPEATTELRFGSTFQLLVAVMLSAQCTDARVNMVTPELFRHLPDAQSMAAASEEQIRKLIASVSYPNSKARHLLATAQMLMNDFGGEVPGTMEELQRLPGVGRKTANVMLGMAFGKAAIAVDTHVFRVSRRIGLSRGTTPIAVEKSLTSHIPADKRFPAHHWLLLHGRYVCKALAPQCSSCEIAGLCKSAGKPKGAR